MNCFSMYQTKKWNSTRTQFATTMMQMFLLQMKLHEFKSAFCSEQQQLCFLGLTNFGMLPCKTKNDLMR